MSETVLWTNPNPTSSSGFAAQVVTLSDDINNYDEIAFEYGYNYASQTGVYVYRVIMSVTDFKKCTWNTSDTRNAVSLAMVNSNNTYYARVAAYNSDTKVRFAQAYQLGGGGTSNTYAIPLNIIGIK